jgi:aromatic ring-opening dioxygenase catalytic subunit (LigB family)
MKRMPAIFIPHGGGPCFFMDWNPPDAWDNQADFLKQLPAAIGETPRAMLVISGHWEEDVVTIQSNPAPELLFDYNGFPAHTYELEYPAPGDPKLSARVAELLGNAGIPTNINTTRGYDHGVFVPLKVAFPDANIPIVQLSLKRDLDPIAHLAIGRALQPLRDEGVLIVGSGNTYHNLRVMMRGTTQDEIAQITGQGFDKWLSEAVCNPDPDERDKLLADWTNAPDANDAHPREEHLIPLHVVAGAAGSDIGVKTLEDHVMGVVESAFQFG